MNELLNNINNINSSAVNILKEVVETDSIDTCRIVELVDDILSFTRSALEEICERDRLRKSKDMIKKGASDD